METRVLDIVAQQLEEQRTRITESLADRSAKDYSEYAFSCGMVRGLLVAQGYIADLRKNMEQSDD